MSQQQYLVAFVILFLAIANYFNLQIAYLKWYRRKIEYQLEAIARGETFNEEESISSSGTLLLTISYLLVGFSIVPFLLFL